MQIGAPLQRGGLDLIKGGVLSNDYRVREKIEPMIQKIEWTQLPFLMLHLTDLTCWETFTRWEARKFQAYIPTRKHQICKDEPKISCKMWTNQWSTATKFVAAKVTFRIGHFGAFFLPLCYYHPNIVWCIGIGSLPSGEGTSILVIQSHLIVRRLSYSLA